MSLQNINEPPSNWLRIYLALRSIDRGFRQFVLVGVPLMLTIGWVASAYFFLSLQFSNFQGFGPARSFLSDLLVVIRFALPSAILILIGVYFLLNRAQAYVSALYKPEPETDLEVKERIWHRLWGWYGSFSFKNFMVVTDTKLESSNHWSTWLGGPAFLIIYDGFAVYLERGNCFSRVVGASSVTYLGARETMKAIIDLRPQIRDGQVNAWTKDGIRIKIKMRVEFQIEPAQSMNSSDAKLVYPFNPIAVRKAVEFTAVRIRDGKLQEADWREGTIGNVTGLVGHHISSCRMDELFLRNGGGAQMLSPGVITGLIEKANIKLTRDAGVRILSLQITDIETSPYVNRQRLDVWEAEKDSLVTRIRGESQAFEIRTNEAVLAKAQRDLIVAIAKSLGKVDSSHFPEPLLLSVSSILDQGLKDPLVQTYMAKGTLDSLKKLQDLL
ncbi:MAG: hypothetical protein HYR70_00620 [Chloroflexi bacterium]|nr:hypothetical protein [Chloroflexota bacterium]MBI3341376.1 hypothetical protein [Chloroflexota bacterium]